MSNPTVKMYALQAKHSIELGDHDSVDEWAHANFSSAYADSLTRAITRCYGDRAERR